MMARAESPCVLPTAELDDARTHLISPPSSMLSSLVAPAQAPAPISLRCVMPERASGPMKDPSSGSAARHRLIDRQAHVHQTPCQLQLLLEGYIADAEPLSSSVEAGARLAEIQEDFLSLKLSKPRSSRDAMSSESDSDLSEPDPPASQIECENRARTMGSFGGTWISSIPPSARRAPATRRSKQLCTPRPDFIESRRPKKPRVNQVPSSLEDGELRERRVRRRGGQSRRPRAGQAKQEQKEQGPMGESRMRRLRARAFRDGEMLCADIFSMARNGLASATGWQGRVPPKKTRAELEALYNNGRIAELLGVFYPVHYAFHSDACEEQGTFLVDSDGCVFVYRSFRGIWLRPLAGDLHAAIQALLWDTLGNRAIELKHRHGPRGPHYPCIIGHSRQYQKSAELTAFHKANFTRVEDFLNNPVIIQINRWVNYVVRQIFPGVADRFDRSVEWYGKRGVFPLFGVYWNLCINAVFPQQSRVHCVPHADRKNIVGVCTLLVYELPGACFNHTQRSWLALWEAGVVIELPPWVLLIYPSSLLYHFNIDITDIQFVATDGRRRPTPKNSRPIVEGDEYGRGSLVYFNQATMYQSSETNSSTLREAVEAGGSGTTDYGTSAQEAFTKHAKYMPMRH